MLSSTIPPNKILTRECFRNNTRNGLEVLRLDRVSHDQRFSFLLFCHSSILPEETYPIGSGMTMKPDKSYKINYGGFLVFAIKKGGKF
jgi:hypothetical protein